MRLLGVHVVGEQATELVHIGLIAMMAEAGADLFEARLFRLLRDLGDVVAALSRRCSTPHCRRRRRRVADASCFVVRGSPGKPLRCVENTVNGLGGWRRWWSGNDPVLQNGR